MLTTSLTPLTQFIIDWSLTPHNTWYWPVVLTLLLLLLLLSHETVVVVSHCCCCCCDSGSLARVQHNFATDSSEWVSAWALTTSTSVSVTRHQLSLLTDGGRTQCYPPVTPQLTGAHTSLTRAWPGPRLHSTTTHTSSCLAKLPGVALSLLFAHDWRLRLVLQQQQPWSHLASVFTNLHQPSTAPSSPPLHHPSNQ